MRKRLREAKLWNGRYAEDIQGLRMSQRGRQAPDTAPDTSHTPWRRLTPRSLGDILVRPIEHIGQPLPALEQRL
jgi:hypothetical protein